MKHETINILLIEDNPEDARLFGELLKEEARGSYHLAQVDRLLIGLARLAADDFDVVFLDLGLPDSKGMDTLKAITKNAVHLPVIVITGLDDESTAIAALRNGAQDYLLKEKIDGSVLWRVLRYSIERKQAEETILNSEEKYRSLVENAGEAILIVQDGLVKFVNGRTTEILGYPGETMLLKPFIEFIYPADRQLAGGQDSGKIKGEESPLGYELRLIDSEGDTKWVDFNAVNTDWEGRPATLNFIRDITHSKKGEQALLDSVEKYRILFEDSMDAIFVTTKEGRFIDVNQSMCKLCGYTMDEMMALPVLSIYADPGYRKVFQKEMEAKGGVREFEITFRKKDGTLIECMITAGAWRRADGKIGGYRGIIDDITERKRSRQALQDSEEKYRTLVESAVEGICVIQDGLLKFVNNSLSASAMFSVDEMTGKPFLDYVHPEDREWIIERESRWMQGEICENSYQFRAISRTGQTRWINLYMVLITWEGKPATLNFLMDITERKQAEDLLIKSEERYRLAIAATDEGLWEWDIQTNTEFFTPRWCEIIGYSFDDPELPHTFQAWESRIHPDDHDRVTAALNNHLEKGMPYDIDYRHQHKSGEYRWQNSRGKAVFARNGKPTKMVGCISDITGRKTAEEKLEKSYESLKKTLNDTINTMVKIMEIRDPYTAGHQQRVAGLAIAIATEMKLEDTRIDQLRTASVIHDIGKMYVPSDILSKPGRLSDIEFSLIRTHPQGGYDVVKGMDFPCDVSKAILQHHERLDGSGYPNHLKGEDTLLEAKILSVADVVEAMSSHRPYRPALGVDKALEEISMGRGIIYDPDVVDACLEIFNSGKFEFKSV